MLVPTASWTFLISILSLKFLSECKELPTVDIPDQGPVIGKEVTVSRGQKASVYLGIPFAQPPIGDLKFAPPDYSTLPSWTEARNASTFYPSCLQSDEGLRKHERILGQILKEQIDSLEFKEDCLYLNIYVPDGTPPPEKWPVVVWFHPGDFKVGSPNLWDGSALAVKQKVLVVVPAYRLNILGFFALDDEASGGNFGMLDQVAALDWVKKRISAFGGSDEDICIMGHGAGGTSVALHMLSPLSEGKFNRAIAMSGSAFSKYIRTIPNRKVYKDISEGFCADDTTAKDVMECYRNIEVKALVEKASDFDWGPVIDNTTGSFLPRDPMEIFIMGKFNKVEFMAGYTDMEDALNIGKNIDNIENGITALEFDYLIEFELSEEFMSEESNISCPANMQHIVDTVLFYYKPHPETSDTTVLRQRYLEYTTEKNYGAGIYKQAMFTSQYTNTYVYRFDYKHKKPLISNIPDWVHVPHGFELPFVWGMPYWPSLQGIVWNGADRKVADIVMNLWTNFAKYGNPIQNGLNYKWEVFKKVTPGVMIIDRNFNMSDPSTFDHRAFDFWNDYFPDVIEATKCCNMTQTGYQIESNPSLTGILATLAGVQFLINS